MTTRDDAIKAGVQAYADMRQERLVLSDVEFVAAVVDAAEPIVRADERERTAEQWNEGSVELYERLAELRAQVEALESPLHWNDGEDALIYRSQVLALLGGESDG